MNKREKYIEVMSAGEKNKAGQEKRRKDFERVARVTVTDVLLGVTPSSLDVISLRAQQPFGQSSVPVLRSRGPKDKNGIKFPKSFQG